MPENTSGARQQAKIFISYSRKDSVFADRLDTALTAHGYDVLLDRSSIGDLEDWRKRIGSLIIKSDTIVFVISPDALVSKECRREVDFAASLSKRFAPVVCRPVDDAAVPEMLGRINRINFVNGDF